MCGHYDDITKFLRRNKNKIDSMETVRTIIDDYTLFFISISGSKSCFLKNTQSILSGSKLVKWKLFYRKVFSVVLVK